MPITVTCPNCHRTFRVGDHFAGRRGLCPDCNAVVVVPDRDPDPPDPPPDDPVPDPRRRRRDPPRRPSPRDHLPAWRRVAVGFLVQQAAAVLLLLGLALLLAGAVLLADDPGDLRAEPNTAQVVSAGLGALALLLGFVGQTVGRLVSAATPVRAPRALAILSAVAGAVQVVGFCLVGFLVTALQIEADEGNAPNPGVEALAGLCLFGWMFAVAAGESIHGFAVGSVGRVLRADGARALGNGLGVLAAVAGLLAIFVFCGLSLWIGNNNPQDPDPTQEQAAAVFAWAIGVGVVLGLYWSLDLLLLQLGRSAVARVAAADADDRAGFDDRWD
jgi:hypothetical protein